MKIRQSSKVFTGFMLSAAAAVPQARGQCSCSLLFDYGFVGSATSVGELVFAKREPGIGCSGALIEEHTVQYDNVPGGVLPTTAEEIYDADPKIGTTNGKKIQDCTPSGNPIGFCVDGHEIVGNEGLGSYTENGVTVTGT